MNDLCAHLLGTTNIVYICKLTLWTSHWLEYPFKQTFTGMLRLRTSTYLQQRTYVRPMYLAPQITHTLFHVLTLQNRRTSVFFTKSSRVSVTGHSSACWPTNITFRNTTTHSVWHFQPWYDTSRSDHHLCLYISPNICWDIIHYWCYRMGTFSFNLHILKKYCCFSVYD